MCIFHYVGRRYIKARAKIETITAEAAARAESIVRDKTMRK